MMGASHLNRSVCVIMACHNRREKTLACLRALTAQRLLAQVAIHALLVDDGSTDGTAEAVADAFPDVEILKGDGQLYWNGAMHRGLNAAMRGGYTFYVLLNDDTVLHTEAIDTVLSTYDQLVTGGHVNSIVVGSVSDPATGEISYGGLRRGPWWIPLRLARALPGAVPVQCDTFNANFVLIPASVAALVGNMDAAFTHASGDYDYGFRAQILGCRIWVAPGILGECQLNRGMGQWPDKTLPALVRWHRLLGPKGLPPREWLEFTRRHSGPFWPVFWINPYLRFWLRVLWDAVSPVPTRRV